MVCPWLQSAQTHVARYALHGLISHFISNRYYDEEGIDQPTL